jgi:hypothetical protein
MKDLHISVTADYDLQMIETLGGVTVHAEDATDVVQMNLKPEDSEKIYEWLKEYLRK